MFLEELQNIRKEVTTRDLDLPLEPTTETVATFYLISKSAYYQFHVTIGNDNRLSFIQS